MATTCPDHYREWYKGLKFMLISWIKSYKLWPKLDKEDNPVNPKNNEPENLKHKSWI